MVTTIMIEYKDDNDNDDESLSNGTLFTGRSTGKMTVESQISYNCTDVMAPVTLSYLSAIMGAIYCPITTIGNGLVIVSILVDPFRELRTQFNFFVVNLAVADLIIGAIIDPFTSWAHFQEAARVEVRKEYPGFVSFCHYTYFASVTASLLNLSALSIDRVIAVRFPLRYRCQVSFVRYRVAALIIWALSFGLPTLYFVIGYVFMAWIMASFSCVFTFIVMVCCYFLLYLFIKNREEEMFARLRSDELKLDDNQTNMFESTAEVSDKRRDGGDDKVASQAHNLTQTRTVRFTNSCVLKSLSSLHRTI